MPADISIETFITGPLETNTYVIRCAGVCAVVDPAMGKAERIPLDEGGPAMILLTHGHGDHIAGVKALKEEFGDARLICPAGDAKMLPNPLRNLSIPFGTFIRCPRADQLVQPGETIAIGDTQWLVLDTSGHTRGGVSYYCAQAGVAIVGDAIFSGSVGRTDIPGGSHARLIENVRANLMSLPDETRVLPGHGPETTIGQERWTNPFLAGNSGGR